VDSGGEQNGRPRIMAAADDEWAVPAGAANTRPVDVPGEADLETGRAGVIRECDDVPSPGLLVKRAEHDRGGRTREEAPELLELGRRSVLEHA